MWLVLQPAAQEAGHEGVAGSEHVVDFDRETLADDTVFEIVGDRAVIDDATHRAALEDDRRRGKRTDGLQRLQQVAFARCDQHLFLGADDQVAIGKHGLEVRRDAVGGDVAAFAGVMTGKAPEVRAIVDVEDDLRAGFLGDTHCLALRRIGVGLGKMRAGDEDRPCLADELFGNVVFAQRIIGAVVAVEQQREGFVVLHGENCKRRQALRIGDDAAGLDAFAGQLLADETAHLLIADAGQKRRLQPEARRADGDVAGAAADRFGKACHVLEPGADLLTVKVDRGPAYGDEVERLCSL